nr:MAG TPA: hypothetical protein [Caudoviricetes sp.]
MHSNHEARLLFLFANLSYNCVKEGLSFTG